MPLSNRNFKIKGKLLQELRERSDLVDELMDNLTHTLYVSNDPKLSSLTTNKGLGYIISYEQYLRDVGDILTELIPKYGESKDMKSALKTCERLGLISFTE